MEILLLLLPISFVLVFVAIRVFLWAVNNGQFENLDENATCALNEPVGGKSNDSSI